jgi:hypothetical protein
MLQTGDFLNDEKKHRERKREHTTSKKKETDMKEREMAPNTSFCLSRQIKTNLL